MIDINNVSVQFSGNYLFKDVSFKINAGDKIALVGANGAGKTTLLKIIYGSQQPESGKVNKQKNTNIGYLPQEIVLHSNKPLFGEVKSSLKEINNLHLEEIEITKKLSDDSLDNVEHNNLIHRLGEIHHRQEEINFYGIDSEIEKVLIGLGFKETDFTKSAKEFSGGWQMRIALASLLLSNNDLLLLDEPTNHLDIDSLEWLINYLKSYKGALLIISHDKHFVNSVTNKTLEIYLNKVSFFKGNLDAYLKYKEERDILLEAQFSQQQKKIKDTEKFIERFRYKATKAKQVQSRIKQLEKIELIELPDSEGSIYIKFPDPPPSGVIPLELKNVTKSYGSNLVLKNVDFRINRGDKIAFVGPNGAGKSTLSKIISNRIDFDSGEKILGHNAVISYYAQDVADSLNPELDIISAVEEMSEDKTLGQLRTLLGSFLFTGDDVFKKIQVLSGGEKSRVAIARILLTKANLIVLDEPTNHLDYSSKKILQKALIDFSGSLVIVSHDVEFLRPIVNYVAEIRDQKLKLYYGNIDYYLQKRNEEIETEKEAEQKVKTNTQVTRKDQKRIEAELRQKKHAATKSLIKEIKILEKEIEELELSKLNLENDLADPEIYSDPNLSKEKNAEYMSVKEKLDEVFLHWAGLTEELENIENQFNN